MKDKFKSKFIEPSTLDQDLDKFYLSKYLMNELREFYTIRERQNFFVKAPGDYKPRVVCKKQWPICYKHLDQVKSHAADKILLLKTHYIMSNVKMDHFSTKKLNTVAMY